MVWRVERRLLPADLLIEILRAIRTARFHEAHVYRPVIFDLCDWLAALLDGYERPLSYRSKGFGQINVRNDLRLCRALMW